MSILDRLYWFLNSAVIAVIVTVIVLILLRMIANQADLNPFGWGARTIRRLTDPLIMPVRRTLAGFGVDPKYAPLVTILLAVLLGWFLRELVSGIANTLAGVLYSLGKHAVAPMIGYVLYGLLGLYSLLIFVRILFSWVTVSYSNRMMRFLVNITEPLLAPLRRLMALNMSLRKSALGAFDFSPIVAFIIVWLFQAAIRGTLLSGWPIGFFQ
jgi:YggT family protein